jgi:hypothetical protein
MLFDSLILVIVYVLGNWLLMFWAPFNFVGGSDGISILILRVALLEVMPIVGLQWFDQCFGNSDFYST